MRFQIEVPVSSAIWQALQRLLVHLAAVRSLPSLLADTGAFRAETMAGAGRMWTVHFLAVLPFVTAHAVALSIGAVAVAVAIGHLALVVSQGALLSFPTRVTLALSVYVLPCNRRERVRRNNNTIIKVQYEI